MADSTRRSFLARASAAGLALPLCDSLAASQPAVARAGDPQRILVLGGTGFLGPHFVATAIARGHKVTLFHRGKTGADLFPQVEHLKGDRDAGDLSALQGREFDVIVDTSGYAPSHVEQSASMFAKTAKQYLFVSTVSVYDESGDAATAISEAGAVLTIADEEADKAKTIREAVPNYGAMKARCEAAAEKAMPGRVANIRPGLIVGPRDTSDRFTWWPVRIDKGGEILAPGDRDALVQMIDARDLGDWMVHCIENRIMGVFNAVGFDGPVTMEEVLFGCRSATSTPGSLTWVSEEFLAEQKVGPWMQMPLWIPRDGRRTYDNAKARAAGMRFRPLADTIRDTLLWAKTERGDRPFSRTGISAERECELLDLWRKRK